MRRVLIIINVVYPKAVKLLLKYYCHNYRWIQNLFDVIKKAELCTRYPVFWINNPSSIILYF